MNLSTDAGETNLCLSMSKTSSTALTAALRQAGIDDVIHLHFLGPQALSIKTQEHLARGKEMEPMLRLALSTSERLRSPHHRFRVVSCVRDPIARNIAHVFESADIYLARDGVDFRNDPLSALGWFAQSFYHDVPLRWFKDTVEDTFGVDYRQFPFDHERKSLRIERPDLKMIVLRQEDPSEPKEAELNWLFDRNDIALPEVNVAWQKSYAEAYDRFKAAFVAPPDMLERLYDSAMVRHFYTDTERERLRQRWSVRADTPQPAR